MRDERQTESLGRKWKDIEGLDNKIFLLRELIGHRDKLMHTFTMWDLCDAMAARSGCCGR